MVVRRQPPEETICDSDYAAATAGGFIDENNLCHTKFEASVHATDRGCHPKTGYRTELWSFTCGGFCENLTKEVKRGRLWMLRRHNSS